MVCCVILSNKGWLVVVCKLHNNLNKSPTRNAFMFFIKYKNVTVSDWILLGLWEGTVTKWRKSGLIWSKLWIEFKSLLLDWNIDLRQCNNSLLWIFIHFMQMTNLQKPEQKKSCQCETAVSADWRRTTTTIFVRPGFESKFILWCFYEITFISPWMKKKMGIAG